MINQLPIGRSKILILNAVETIVDGQSGIYKKLEEHDKEFIEIKARLGNVESTLQDVQRRVIDLEHDTPTENQLKKIDKRQKKVEKNLESN